MTTTQARAKKVIPAPPTARLAIALPPRRLACDAARTSALGLDARVPDQLADAVDFLLHHDRKLGRRVSDHFRAVFQEKVFDMGFCKRGDRLAVETLNNHHGRA